MKALAGLLALLVAILPLAHVPALRVVLALAATVAIAAVLLRERRIPLPAWPMAAWALVGVASLLWSTDRQASLHDLFYAMVLPVGVFLAAWRVAREDRVFRYLHAIAVLSAIPLFVMVTAAVATGHFSSLLPDAQVVGLLRYWPGVGVASTFACLIAPFALLFAASSAVRRKVAGWLALLALVAVAAATLNRMAWPALLATGVAFSAWQWRAFSPVSRRAAAIGLLAAAGVAVTAFQQVNEERHPGAELDVVAKDVRFQGWREWLAIVAEAPLLGHGFGRSAVQAAGSGHLSATLLHRDEQLAAHGHNILLDTAVETGILGLALYCVLLGALLREFWRLGGRQAAPEALALGATGCSLVISMLAKNFTDDFMQQAVLLAFWAYAGMVLGALEAAAARRAKPA